MFLVVRHSHTVLPRGTLIPVEKSIFFPLVPVQGGTDRDSQGPRWTVDEKFLRIVGSYVLGTLSVSIVQTSSEQIRRERPEGEGWEGSTLVYGGQWSGKTV